MIRYPLDLPALVARINAQNPGWMKRAAKRTTSIIRAGTYAEKSSIWGEIKPFFVELQYHKCIFCECLLEYQKDGRVTTTLEHDLEHFRPKNAVQNWPDRAVHSRLQYAFPTGGAYPSGYFWLAYELTNYAAACKTCNSSFKHVYFPVAGMRPVVPVSAADAPLPEVLQNSEMPFLCNPLGRIDDDPEELITFIGTTAVPVHASGPKRDRASVIIDFFGLNVRDFLHKDRAKMICIFGPAFQNRANGVATASDRQMIAKIGQPQQPHASCLKAFAGLWATDMPLASRILEACRALVLNDA